MLCQNPQIPSYDRDVTFSISHQRRSVRIVESPSHILFWLCDMHARRSSLVVVQESEVRYAVVSYESTASVNESAESWFQAKPESYYKAILGALCFG